MKTTTLKTTLAALTALSITVISSVANRGDFSAGIGFMERSDTGYGFVKGNGVVYQDEKFKHKLGLELLGYQETLDKNLDTDLRYTTLIANYEVEYKANNVFSLFIGAGGGMQFVDLDSPAGSLDDDTYGYAQVFGGVRAKLSDSVDLHIGVRRMFFDDYELLDVSGLKQEQTWGFEIGLTMTF